MRIKYITNVRIPTPRAQGYAIIKVCSEFAKLGIKTELFVPDRKVIGIEKDPFLYYKTNRNFKINKIKSLDLLSKTQKFGPLFYWLDILSFFVSARIKIKIETGDIIYSRDYLTALFFPTRNFVCLEIHDIPKSKLLFKKALQKSKIIFVLNQNIKKELSLLGISDKKIFISPSGVDIEEFDVDVNKERAREKVNLPKSKKTILYTGHLYKWKGADTLAETAKFMPETLFVFVGGVKPDLEIFENKYKKYKNIIVRPSVERSMIPTYLKAADVLALPNSASEKISVKYTSPIKMFEYMASKRPVVASDLPSIREVLDESNCLFAKPDNPESFARAIKKILTDDRLSEKIVNNAFAKVKNYTWQKKAENILKQIYENSF